MDVTKINITTVGLSNTGSEVNDESDHGQWVGLEPDEAREK